MHTIKKAKDIKIGEEFYHLGKLVHGFRVLNPYGENEKEIAYIDINNPLAYSFMDYDEPLA